MRPNLKKYLTLLAFFNSVSLQVNASSLEQQIPIDLIKSTGNKFLTITTENDFFGGGTDQNYTNGLRITYFDVNTELPEFSKKLASYIPTFEINKTTSTYYSIGHNIYTPEKIELNPPNPKNRPYAGFLYTSAGLTSITGNHIDDIEFTLGIVGPAALGKEVQRNYHKLIDSDDPKGWDSQLKNELGIMISWQRRWPVVFSGVLNDKFFYRASPHLGVTLGNVYTYANTGMTLQLLPKEDVWQSLPIRVRPAIPGNGAFATFGHKWSWMLFAGLDGRAIGHNIFLDGNTFSESPSVDRYNFVYDANAGAAITYDRLRISFTMNLRSKEFNDDENSHKFGIISIGYKF